MLAVFLLLNFGDGVVFAFNLFPCSVLAQRLADLAPWELGLPGGTFPAPPPPNEELCKC
jgi:hypothetical protein